MSIGTEERTRPRLGLYYTIVIGAFVASMAALLTLSGAAYALVVAVSVIAVIAARMKLGVSGSLIVVDEPLLSLRWHVALAYRTWRPIAAWCVAMVVVFAIITATKSMPLEWQGRAILLAMSGSFCMLAHYGVSELRSVIADLSNTELNRKRLALRAILGITLIVLAAAFFYYALQRDLPQYGQSMAIIAAWGVFLLTKHVAEKSAPTPPAPSPPAAG